MSIRLEKAWLPLTRESVAGLPGQLGVYQIGDSSGRTLFIGYAGGRSRFGLRGELESECERRGREGQEEAGSGRRFRYEVNVQYMTRWQELLMVHQADHGELPAENDRPPGLGRLTPR